MTRSWIVTGCSSGIGRSIAETLLAEGEAVAVTARRPESIADLAAAFPDRALALELDVTDRASVDAAVAAATERFGGIDVLVNNAGYGYVAPIEAGEEDEVRALFDTNFFGPLRMMQAVLPGMRARRSGAIVQISSLAGRISNPATGYYSATKFALEAMSEALAREVAPLGIRVTSIAPGMFRSDFSGRSLKLGHADPGDYAAVAERMALVRSANGRQQGDPAKLARLVMAVADMADPPRQLIAGPDAYAAIAARMQETGDTMAAFRDMSIGTDFDPAG